ncbi:MAG TPA: hypothetical protein VJ063_11440 [Verrucomicrobiae bacterium]|nr:hypothetical protein [Verrucomicrobiae bacterium]
MNPRTFLVFPLILLPLIAKAHVGSPNVFFQGKAGPYDLRVIIRPPAALPGIAQADVRVNDGTAKSIFLQAAIWDADADGAPTPVRAVAVAGETNLFNAALWLLRSGSYSVRVMVQGNRGDGSVLIPLNSAPFEGPGMSPRMRIALILAGALLFVAALWLVGAAARDSTVAPDAAPAVQDYYRAPVATIIAALLLAGAICAASIRWQKMDREFQNHAVHKPVAVWSDVRTNGSLHLLQLRPDNRSEPSRPWDTLVADHGKLMHLFLVRLPRLDAFAHLHPVRRGATNFEAVLPPLPAGDYFLYADITHEDGLTQTLVDSLRLPAPVGAPRQLMRTNEVFCLSVVPANTAGPFALDADDSWHIGQSSAQSNKAVLMGGNTMVLETPETLIANRETSLRFRVFDRQGARVALQPYMGMLGHAVVRQVNGVVFTHLHPVGTISMAAQELLRRREGAGPISPPGGNPTNEVSFPYAFPSPGSYRLWVQVRTDGRVLTGVFDVMVASR